MSGSLPTPSGWPLGGVDADGRLRWTRGSAALAEAVWNILATNPGERLMRPAFGAGLGAFIHQPNTETTRRLIAAAARDALGQAEPRIVLQAVTVDSPADAGSAAAAQVRLTLRWHQRGREAEEGSLSLGLQLGG